MSVTSLERLEAALAAAPTVRVTREAFSLHVHDPASQPTRRKFGRPTVQVPALLVTVTAPEDAPFAKYPDHYQLIFLESGRFVASHWTYRTPNSVGMVRRASFQAPSRPFEWPASYRSLSEVIDFIEQYTTEQVSRYPEGALETE